MDIAKDLSVFVKFSKFKAGLGDKIRFWEDIWINQASHPEFEFDFR